MNGQTRYSPGDFPTAESINHGEEAWEVALGARPEGPTFRRVEIRADRDLGPYHVVRLGEVPLRRRVRRTLTLRAPHQLAPGNI